MRTINKTVLFTGFYLLPVAQFCAQVYNYDPVRYSNVETNPAYTAAQSQRFSANYMHYGGFYRANQFSSDAFRLSYYNTKKFTGIGLVLNNTQVNAQAQYRYVGLSAAYRLIVLNRFYLRLGLLYKTGVINTSPGNFDYRSFYNTSENKLSSQFFSNSNLSLSFSTPREKKYFSLAILNSRLLSTASSYVFPMYYVASAGTQNDYLEFSYTAFLKKQADASHFLQSHYLTLIYNGFALNRLSRLRLGLRAGLADERYVQLNPMIGIYSKHKGHYRAFQLIYDLGLNNNGHLPYTPSYQFNVLYLF